MKGINSLAQLILRYALGIGFILPVLDRIGWLGAPGDKNVGWGNWENFTNYTHSLVPYVTIQAASFLGFIALAAEVLFGILLIIGYKTKLAAYGSFLLTLIFALSMLFFSSYRAPFNYSVFVVSFSSLLLSNYPDFTWSVDKILSKKSNQLI